MELEFLTLNEFYEKYEKHQKDIRVAHMNFMGAATLMITSQSADRYKLGFHYLSNDTLNFIKKYAIGDVEVVPSSYPPIIGGLDEFNHPHIINVWVIVSGENKIFIQVVNADTPIELPFSKRP